MTVIIKKENSSDWGWQWDGQVLRKENSSDWGWKADGEVSIPILAVIAGIID
jgi:hypothetical protein